MDWDNTLYKITPETILAFSQLWGAEEKSLQLVSKGINLVYQFENSIFNSKNKIKMLLRRSLY